MRVLVTGGTGFMGSHLADRFLDRGAEVVVLGLEKRPEEKENADNLRKRGAQVVLGSVTDTGLVRPLLEGTDYVFHLAVAMREAGTGDDYFRKVNVEGTRFLLEASREAGVRRFIYCSTVGIVGHHQGEINNEGAPPNPGDIYQTTKHEAETLVLKFGREHDYPVTAMRPAEVYGPRDRRLLKLFGGVKRGVFPMVGNGRGKHHLVYVDDCNDLFEILVEHPNAVGEVFIGAGPEAPTLKELVRKVADVAGCRPPWIRIPYWPMRLLAAVVEDVCGLLRVQPPLYRRRVEFYTHDYEFDISKASRMLGWQPKTDLGTGIAKTLAWYEEAGLA